MRTVIASTSALSEATSERLAATFQAISSRIAVAQHRPLAFGKLKGKSLGPRYACMQENLFFGFRFFLQSYLTRLAAGVFAFRLFSNDALVESPGIFLRRGGDMPDRVSTGRTLAF